MNENEKQTVLALGFFDGVHIGHAALLETAKCRAAQRGAEPVVLTFDMHPDMLVKRTEVALLNSAADRAYILRRYFSIDRVCYIHFDAETMHQDWQTFLEHIITQYSAAHFVVGQDFTFGDCGRGNAALLADYCAAHGLGCDVIPEVVCDGTPVSSTGIRVLVRAGEMERAALLLGHPHLLTGIVHTGHRMGRTMDFPTVNLAFAPGVLVPPHGVYAARAVLPGGVYNGVANIGVRPTFGGKTLTVETNIFDFSGDLYGQEICVELHAFLRPERPFPSAEALSAQIRSDADRARAYFAQGTGT